MVMKNERYRTLVVLVASLAAMSACQSTGQPGDKPVAGATNSAAPIAAAQAAAPVSVAYAPPSASTPAMCAVQLAAGPPPKPDKGADFGKAAAKNVGKNIGRSLISSIAGGVAGPLGGAVAGGLATNAIRSEQDLKGTWTATDGRSDCGCRLDISAATNLQLKTANAGRMAAKDCGHPMLAQSARWSLGHSFTGYDAPFQIMGSDGRTVVATLNRDGVDYFSGQLADGTPVTIWRE